MDMKKLIIIVLINNNYRGYLIVKFELSSELIIYNMFLIDI